MHDFDNLQGFLEHVALATSIDQDWDGEKVNFTLHYSKLIEYLIRYKVEEFDVIPTEFYAYNEQLGLKVYAWPPDSLAEEFRDMISKDVCHHATIPGNTFNLNMGQALKKNN
ncbi:MAG: hypothetical protein HN757_17095 [Calditrichaeota bacterium]|nr:hypothetical protein [Calditrichota bacterium]